MRKLLVLCLLALALALLGLAAPALAVPVEDLSALAQYFPDSTVFFASLRTDDGYLETLDGVVGQLRDLLPPGMLPQFRLEMALDQAVAPLGMGSFRKVVRPWLGGTAAVGVTRLDSAMIGTPSFLLAVEITDRAAAAKFVETLLTQSNSEFETSEQGGYTLFSDPRGQGAFAIGDDVLFLTIATADVPGLGEDFAPLSASATFAGSLAMLPLDDYNILAYLNAQSFVDFAMQMSAQTGEEIPPAVSGLLNAAGAQVYGLTILDGRSLVIDIAQAAGDTTGLTEAGFTLEVPTASFDPAFAARVPADAPMVILGADLATSFEAGFQNARAFGRLLREQLRMMPMSNFMPDDERAFRELAQTLNLGSVAVRWSELSFTALTGANFTEDVLPWLGGNYALYLRALPLPPQTGLPVTLDMAAVVEGTDPAGPAALVDSIAATFADYEVPFENIGDGSLVFTGVIPALFPPDMREDMRAVREFDLIVGSRDGVFVAGTRPGAAFSLSPNGDTLADAPAYNEALAYALEGAQQFWYLNTPAFAPLLDDLLARPGLGNRAERDLRDLKVLAGLFSSGSISLMAGENGSMTARAVLTLAQDPLP